MQVITERSQIWLRRNPYECQRFRRIGVLPVSMGRIQVSPWPDLAAHLSIYRGSCAALDHPLCATGYCAHTWHLDSDRTHPGHDLAIFVLVVMRNELKLFRNIKTAYRQEQNKLLDEDLQHDLKKKSHFNDQVLFYLGVLAVLSLANGLITIFVWVPKVLEMPLCWCQERAKFIWCRPRWRSPFRVGRWLSAFSWISNEKNV